MLGVSDSERKSEELISFEELRARGQVIEHKTPGSIIYSELKSCQRCGSVFSSSHDFNSHKQVCEERDWMDSNYDDGQICPSAKQPELVHACKVHNGIVKNGLYEYTLSKNGQWLKRKKI